MKFYVTDGTVQLVVLSDSIHGAAMAFIKKFYGRGIMIGPHIYVSESGFNKEHSVNTDELLKCIFNDTK